MTGRITRRAAPPLVVAAPMLLEAWAVRRGLASHAASVDVVRAGVGEGAARRSAGRLTAHPARCLAVAGLAGAVDAALAPGDVVVATELRGPGGRTSLPDGADLVGDLEALGLRVHGASIACVDHVVRGAERESLRARGVRAVDMESFWLAEAARERPFVCVRVIVDAPGHELLSPSIVSRGTRALAVLSRAVSVLPAWAARQASRPVQVSNSAA